MSVPTFVDLQGFLIGKKFIVKEFAALEKGTLVSHYTFTSPAPWIALTKFERSCASWLTAYHHGLLWEDGAIPYSAMRLLVTQAVFGDKTTDDAPIVVYVKGLEKRNWLRDMLLDDQRERVRIETLDAVYEDVESLKRMNATAAPRCARHGRDCVAVDALPYDRPDRHEWCVKHDNFLCALQNVFKLYNWWSRREKNK